jgi:hypothetical protein
MSLNADKTAPIAVSVEERRRIWTLPEVEVLLEQQTKVGCACTIAVNISHVSVKAKRACIAEHGSVGSAKGTPEGESYRHAYGAAKTAIARHERHSFAIERKQWFENQDTRLLASNPMVRYISGCAALPSYNYHLQPPTIDIEEPLSELPTPEQEADINNLDLLAVREKFGHIDYNAATGDDIADIFGNGALASVVDASIMMDHDTNLSTTFPNNEPTTSTLSAPSVYDPSVHYPPNLFQNLFAGGFEDSGSLSDRFSAWKQLAALPSLKTIPRQTFTSKHYKGECPTDDLKCPIVDCGDDLTYAISDVSPKARFSYFFVSGKTASQRTIHIHSCTRRQKQKEADDKINKLYPQTDMCPFSCNADLSSSSRSAYARHIKQHIATRANHSKQHGWRCGVINGDAECSTECVFVTLLAFYPLTLFLQNGDQERSPSSLTRCTFHQRLSGVCQFLLLVP